MEIFKVKDNNKEEEDLIEEEAKSYVIIVDNQDTLLEIVQVLWKTCTYYKSFDHTIEQCLQLIVKWQAWIMRNPNPAQNPNSNPNQKSK